MHNYCPNESIPENRNAIMMKFADIAGVLHRFMLMTMVLIIIKNAASKSRINSL